MESGPKKFPSQDPALIKARREIKQIEDSLHRQNIRIKELEEENDNLKKENGKLKEELLVLRQPPEWIKANKSEEASKQSKKVGPKKGHPCFPRKRPEQADREVQLIAKHCPECDHELPFPHKWHEHVQIDVPPPPKVIVTRYHVGWSFCSVCKKEVSSKEKLSGSLYGPHLHSQVCYWKFSLGLTFNKIQRLLKELYELKVSRGELSGLVSRSAASFKGAYEDLKTSLLDQSHLHADETGWRVEGNNHWMWSFSNHQLSYYHLDESRGQKVVKEVLGESYRGILVSDFYGGYNAIDCLKQKCWVHLLREVHELKEKWPKEQEIRLYLKRLKRFYSRGVKLKELYESGKEVSKPLNRLQNDTSQFAHQKSKHPDLNRLSKRMIKYRSELYIFIKSGIDPTNNPAEREIRPAVLMRKTSYGNRSSRGGKNQAILMSMIRTAQKQNKDFIQLATQSLIHH